MKLYALHDKKAGSLSNFHVEKSDAVASRGFAEAVRDPKSVFFRYADDFELVAVATVSEDSYVVGSPVEGIPVTPVITAAQVVASMPAVPSDGQLSLLKEA